MTKHEGVGNREGTNNKSLRMNLKRNELLGDVYPTPKQINFKRQDLI